MRCLIPVHQEMYPENSINRAKKLCDEIVLLYIIDRKLIEKVKSEASYILPSYALDNVEEFIVNIHRKEAEKIKNKIRNVPVNLKFIVGEYYESVEKEILRSSPDMLMSDFFQRGFLRMNLPIWIDRGGEIKECTLVIKSLKKIKRVKHAIEFTQSICEKLNSLLFIYYSPGDEEGLNVLKPLGKLVNEPEGEMLVFMKEQLKKLPENKCILLL
jgi:hypothetical protein